MLVDKPQGKYNSSDMSQKRTKIKLIPESKDERRATVVGVISGPIGVLVLLIADTLWGYLSQAENYLFRDREKAPPERGEVLRLRIVGPAGCACRETPCR